MAEAFSFLYGMHLENMSYDEALWRGSIPSSSMTFAGVPSERKMAGHSKLRKFDRVMICMGEACVRAVTSFGVVLALSIWWCSVPRHPFLVDFAQTRRHLVSSTHLRPPRPRGAACLAPATTTRRAFATAWRSFVGSPPTPICPVLFFLRSS